MMKLTTVDVKPDTSSTAFCRDALKHPYQDQVSEFVIRRDGMAEDIENGKAKPLQPAASFSKELELLPGEIIMAAWKPLLVNHEVGVSYVGGMARVP